MATIPQVLHPDWLLLFIEDGLWSNGQEVAEATAENADGQHPARICRRIRVWCIKQVCLDSLLQPKVGNMFSSWHIQQDGILNLRDGVQCGLVRARMTVVGFSAGGS